MADAKQEYSRVAKNKIALMIRQKVFARIVSIDDKNTRLEFTDCRVCDVDVWGRVTWQ